MKMSLRSVRGPVAPVYHWRVGKLTVLLPSVLLLGCAAAPTPRPVAEEAAQMERARCGSDMDEETLAPLFADENIDAAEPLYAAVSSGGGGAGGNYSQLIGASIKLRAVKGFTATWLDRALECHSARRVLGLIPEATLPNDLFWLPGRMVDIEVAATQAGFQVFIRGRSIPDAEKILARANAFVETSQHR